MKNGILIINEFLHSNKFSEIHMWLVEAAKRKEMQLSIKTNAEILILLDNNYPVIKQGKEKLDDHFPFHEMEKDIDFILFWDKDIRLARYLEYLGYRVFNSSRAIEACDDKSLTHLILQNAGIPMPKTVVAPMTFEGIGYTNYHFTNQVIGTLGFPMIVKECFGSFGQQVYLIHNQEEMLNKLKWIGTKPILFQEYIQSSFARDIRLNVVGDQVVAAMYRYSENGDFRANITNGGKMKPYVPTKEQEALALSCCKELGLDFAGVDLLFGEKEEPIVCEVNSNAHFKNIYDCTKINVADNIMEYILDKLEEGLI